tara:strand:- start:352 stop:2307 length:1956 start_codon:yes stop_codon:yes gene_type:complete
MGTARNFHVKTGLVVDNGDLSLTAGNLLVNGGYIDVDKLTLDGQTISTLTGNEDIYITPHGTGSVIISKVDINSGTVDAITSLTAAGNLDIGAYGLTALTFTSDIASATGPPLIVTSTANVPNLNASLLNGATFAAPGAIGGSTAAAGTFTDITGTDLDINGAADISGTTVMSGAISTGAAAADTTITQVTSAADSAGRSFTVTAGSPPSGSTDNTGVGGNLVLSGGKGKGTAAGGSILFKVADGGVSGTSLNSHATALTIADDKSIAIAGVTSFGADTTGVDVTFHSATSSDNMLWDASAKQLVITGTNATTSLNVADGNVTIADTLTATSIGAFQATGAIDFNTQAMTNVDINSGAIDNTPIGAGTANTIKGTTIDATTDFTIGSTVITDDQIQFTPSTSDTVTITAATNAEFTIATIDDNAEAGHINLQADGNVRLKYTSSTKLETKSTGVDVTGHLEGSTSIHSAYARMRVSDGIEDGAGYGSAGSHPILDIDGSNFYTSETLAVTETSGRSKLPSGTYGTNDANVGNVIVLELNIEQEGSFDTFQAAEAFCALSIKDASGTIEYRVINKIFGTVNNNGDVETVTVFESGDVNVGHFHFVKATDGFGANRDSMVIVFRYTSVITHDSNAQTTYSVNCNGLSLSGAGG